MTTDEEKIEQVEQLLDTEDLADALQSDKFRKFLDQIPLALAVAEFGDTEGIVYANPKFETLCGQNLADLTGKPWNCLSGAEYLTDNGRRLCDALIEDSERIGTFQLDRDGHEPAVVDAYANVIEDENGVPAFRLVALIDVTAVEQAQREAWEQQLRDKDMLLRDLQHRVKNNLQMITALIRIEARNMGDKDTTAFDRLAGRIESLALLYRALSEDSHGQELDLGIYLSQIASAVMAAHGVEGIRLDLKVDMYRVSINVAMPTGLVVNELLTNALKYAFAGRDGGAITLHSIADGEGCTVIVADDGPGLPDGVKWPQPRRLGALIVQSLRENAKATIDVQSSPKGMRVTIRFKRAAAAAV